MTHEQAAIAGVAMAMGLWVVAAAALCVIFVVGRAGLNRGRATAWQQEWARIEPDWTRSS